MGRQKANANREQSLPRVGILTFYCADNYGALLQAYALRTWLCEHRFDAQVIPYAPFYMVSRDWLFPLLPPVREGGNWKILPRGAWHFVQDLPALPDICKRKRRMRSFRREQLGVCGCKLRWAWQLGSLRYDAYIVGGDQIWNPAITFGLRQAYFGAFPGWQGRVIAYAASLGTAQLAPEYRERFTELLHSVSAVSVREAGAVPYVTQMGAQNVCAMPDPVFLLKREQWEKLETPARLPGSAPYLLYHAVESNKQMAAFAKAFAAAKGLKVVELCYRRGKEHTGTWTVYSAGPSEFLSLIHGAGYIVSNSFHALAMSILYRKPFTAFTHSTVGERILGLLDLCGLQERLYNGRETIADTPIAWAAVSERIARAAREAEGYLSVNISKAQGHAPQERSKALSLTAEGGARDGQRQP